MKRTTVLLFQIISFIFLVSASAQAKEWEKMVNRQPSRVKKLFSETKSICVGRFMLDVPSNSIVVYGPASAPYAIERRQGEAPRLLEIVEEIRKEAQVRKSPFPIGPASSPGSKVGTVVQGFDEKQKIVYGVDSDTGAYYKLHSIVAVGDDLYVQSVSFYGEISELEMIEAELKSVASRILPRDANTLPVELGVCIDGAFVVDRGHSHHERATLGVRLNDFDDVHFAFETILKDRVIESDALEPRLRSAEEQAKLSGHGDWYAQIKFFRRGERRIGNWKGFEALARRPPQGKFGSSHDFTFVSHGEPNNPELPVLSIDLYTGVQGNSLGGFSSLSDDEVIELWDKLTSSIRPRPVQAPHSQEVKQP